MYDRGVRGAKTKMLRPSPKTNVRRPERQIRRKNMRSAQAFFNWAFTTRAKTVMKIYNDEQISPEKMFLSFCSHDPAFISHGPAGLNGSIKGIGFMPKPAYLEETLEAYINHIKTYDP